MSNYNFSPPEDAAISSPRWMISFADLMSVVLTFFVLMFSMAIPPTEFEESNNDYNKLHPEAYSITQEGTTKITVARTDLGLSTDYLYNIIRDQKTNYPGLEKIKLSTIGEKLVVSVPVKQFDRETAQGIVYILRNLDNQAAVYTSNLDIGEVVVKTLQKEGLEKEISFFERRSLRGKIDIVIYP